jgi:hypothetical protein
MLDAVHIKLKRVDLLTEAPVFFSNLNRSRLRTVLIVVFLDQCTPVIHRKNLDSRGPWISAVIIFQIEKISIVFSIVELHLYILLQPIAC